MRDPSRKVGIKEIAEAADVAVSTVSHVLNGTAPISAEVRERVLNAANSLGYLARRREKASIAVLRGVLLGTVEGVVREHVIVKLATSIKRGDGIVLEGDRVAGTEQGQAGRRGPPATPDCPAMTADHR